MREAGRAGRNPEEMQKEKIILFLEKNLFLKKFKNFKKSKKL